MDEPAGALSKGTISFSLGLVIPFLNKGKAVPGFVNVKLL